MCSSKHIGKYLSKIVVFIEMQLLNNLTYRVYSEVLFFVIMLQLTWVNKLLRVGMRIFELSMPNTIPFILFHSPPRPSQLKLKSLLLLKNCRKKWCSVLHLNNSPFPFSQKNYRHSVINWMFWGVLYLLLYWNGFSMINTRRNYNAKFEPIQSDYEMHLKETNFFMCENNFSVTVNLTVCFSTGLKLILRK